MQECQLASIINTFLKKCSQLIVCEAAKRKLEIFMRTCTKNNEKYCGMFIDNHYHYCGKKLLKGTFMVFS